jgi:hypothetical protein
VLAFPELELVPELRLASQEPEPFPELELLPEPELVPQALVFQPVCSLK